MVFHTNTIFTQPELFLDRIYNWFLLRSHLCYYEASQLFHMTTKMVRGRLGFVVLAKERSSQEVHNEILN